MTLVKALLHPHRTLSNFHAQMVAEVEAALAKIELTYTDEGEDF